MYETGKTEFSRMRIRKSVLMEEAEQNAPDCDENASGVSWEAARKGRTGEKLLKNLTIASALAICAVALRQGAVPSLESLTDVVMTAAKDESLLDEQLGKLSFVSSLFPETVLVFGEASSEMYMPVNAPAVVHAWSEQEPYLVLRSTGADVLAASDGEVIGVYHGNGDERLVQVLGEDGLACMYGNLASVSVTTGDYVTVGMLLGRLKEDAELVFEVRRDGVSMDPALCLEGL